MIFNLLASVSFVYCMIESNYSNTVLNPSGLKTNQVSNQEAVTRPAKLVRFYSNQGQPISRQSRKTTLASADYSASQTSQKEYINHQPFCQSSLQNQPIKYEILSLCPIISRWDSLATFSGERNLGIRCHGAVELCFYKRPCLIGSVWHSMKQAFPHNEAEIRMKNSFVGFLRATKLTQSILALSHHIDSVIRAGGALIFSSRFTAEPESYLELGFTPIELLKYRLISNFRPEPFKKDSITIVNQIRARVIYNDVSLHSDIAAVLLRVLELLDTNDQRELTVLLGNKLASLIFLYNFSVQFQVDLSSPARHQIDVFINSQPTRDTIDQIIQSGRRIQAVLMYIMNPNPNISEFIKKVNAKFVDLAAIQDQFNSKSTDVSNQVTDKNNKINAGSNAQDVERSRYEKALIELNITNQTPQETDRDQTLNIYVTSIEYAIEKILAKTNTVPILVEENRNRLMLSMDQATISSLSTNELTVYLGILQEEERLVNPIIHKVKNLSIGDDLDKFARKAYAGRWPLNHYMLNMIGSYLARTAKNALAEGFFWKTAAMDDERLAELKRFIDLEIGLENAGVEIASGYKLRDVFKMDTGCCQSIQALKDIEIKLSIYKSFDNKD